MKKIIKKIIISLIIVALVTGLFSCKKNLRDIYEVSGKDSDKEYRIGMITDLGGIHDEGFNQSSWMGMKKFSEAHPDVAVEFLESRIEEDYDINIEYLARHKLDLIIGIGYAMAGNIRHAAAQMPKQKFAIIDDDSCKNFKNVTCVMFKQEQASYLVGIVAGLMTKTNVIGYVQGNESPVMNLFDIGFIEGVRAVNSKAKIIQRNTNTFIDQEVGYKLATKLIDNEKVDIIYHAAGATGIGIIKACDEKGIYAIGVDTDQSYLAPNTVVTSAIKRVDLAIFDICESLLKKELKGGVYTYDINNGGIDIAQTSSLLPMNVIKIVEEKKEAIKAGRIVVPTEVEECKEFDLVDISN